MAKVKQEVQYDIWELIRKTYPSKEYVLLSEVRDAAGFNASRSADGIAMNLWPSRGLELTGFEIKKSRTDWLKEKNQPEKAENIFKYCDRFYLIAGNDKVILNENEIPKSWGYMLAKGSRLVVVKEAPKLKPKECSRTFLASMLKRATKGMLHPSEIDGKMKEVADKARKELLFELDEGEDELKRRYAKLLEDVRMFEEASGISINKEWTHDPKKIGAAVGLVLKKGTGYFASIAWRGKSEILRISRELNDVVKKLTDGQLPEEMERMDAFKNQVVNQTEEQKQTLGT